MSDLIHYFKNDKSGVLKHIYKLYHEEIDPLISKYELALQQDAKAIGKIKLAALNSVLNVNDVNADIVPYAAHLRVIINEYREKYEYEEPDMVIYDIRETFEKSGEKILRKVFQNGFYGLTITELYERLKTFEYEYHKWGYKDYCGTKTFDDFVAEESWEDFEDINVYMYIYYRDKSFWNVFSKESDRFGDMSSSIRDKERIIQEAKKEIEWRNEYLKNPNQNSLVRNMETLCEKTIIDLISVTLQALQINIDINFEEQNTEDIHRKSEPYTEKDEEVYPAQLLIDYSNSGGFKSNGCQKSFEMLCSCLNTHETITTILGHLSNLCRNHNECATQTINKPLLDKIMTSTLSKYLNFDADEEPLFYKDSAIMFYGKNGILITNKSIYRIRKNGIKKISISNLNSIHLSNLLFETEADCKWYFNADIDFDLDAMGINAEQSGIIMALICLLFAKINPNKKIKFFNYV